MGTKVVFFGVLRFLSGVDAFSSIKIATDWNSVSCYVTTSNNTILLCMLFTNGSKLILSCCHRCFLWFKFSEDKHWHSFMPPVFLFQWLWFFRRFYWRNVFPRWPTVQFPDQRVNGIMRTSGEIDFRFRLELKITLVESTYPSQRPQCPSSIVQNKGKIIKSTYLFLLCVYFAFLWIWRLEAFQNDSS